MISLQCEKCQRKLRVPKTAAGRIVPCPCGERLEIPARQDRAVFPNRTVTVEDKAHRASSPSADLFTHGCVCGRTLRVEKQSSQRRAKCPCGSPFEVPAKTTIVPALPVPARVLTAIPVTTASPVFVNNPKPIPVPSAGTSWSDDIPAPLQVSQVSGVANYHPPMSSSDSRNAYATSSASIANDYLANAERERRNSNRSQEHDFSGFFNSTVLGGLIGMFIAVIWFTVGLACGIIFFYPPVMFFFSLIAFAKGLLDGD